MEGGIGGDSGLLHLVGSKSIVMMIIVYTWWINAGKKKFQLKIIGDWEPPYRRQHLEEVKSDKCKGEI